MLASTLVILVSALVCIANPLPSSDLWKRAPLKVKHAWVQVPQGWKVVGDAPVEHQINLRIALKQANTSRAFLTYRTNEHIESD